MSTTSAYGWNIPDNTDLVKDGALAIRTLGNAIDTSMNTALGTRKAGMVLLNTTSFSAVSSISLPANTFTSTYNTYFFTFDITASTALNIQARLRAAGTDNSSTIYGSTSWENTNPVSSSGAASQSIWSAIGQAFDSDMKRNTLSWTLSEPKSSTKFTTGNSIYVSNIGTTPYPIMNFQGTNVTTSFDSVTFIPSTGTISGSISCYGFNK